MTPNPSLSPPVSFTLFNSTEFYLTATKKERITDKAFELLGATPQGIQFSELVTQLHTAFPDDPHGTIILVGLADALCLQTPANTRLSSTYSGNTYATRNMILPICAEDSISLCAATMSSSANVWCMTGVTFLAANSGHTCSFNETAIAAF